MELYVAVIWMYDAMVISINRINVGAHLALKLVLLGVVLSLLLRVRC
jgi:hypothetical protein